MKLNKAYIPMRGGLGNQMFIFCFSKYLENYNIKINLVWYEYIFTKHHYGIELFHAFEIEKNKKNAKYNIYLFLNKIIKIKLLKSLLGRFFSCFYIFIKKVKQKSPYTYNIDFLKINSNAIYLDGFWQNHNYIDSINVKNLFKFRLPQNYQHNSILKMIHDSESVAVHIRRGDYLENTFKEYQVIKNNQYFLNSISKLRNLLIKPKFFIFSDDFDWVKENIVGDDIIYVEINKGKNSYLDMYLMSQCKNNIISNSTFSFWGAYLNSNISKLVICPDFWTTEIKSKSFCPKEWIYIEV